MININLKVLINESDMTKVDDHIIGSILELVEKDRSLDSFIKYRINKLKEHGINNKSIRLLSIIMNK